MCFVTHFPVQADSRSGPIQRASDYTAKTLPRKDFLALSRLQSTATVRGDCRIYNLLIDIALSAHFRVLACSLRTSALYASQPSTPKPG